MDLQQIRDALDTERIIWRDQRIRGCNRNIKRQTLDRIDRLLDQWQAAQAEPPTASMAKSA